MTAIGIDIGVRIPNAGDCWSKLSTCAFPSAINLSSPIDLFQVKEMACCKATVIGL
jgi:hypothetical protein